MRTCYIFFKNSLKNTKTLYFTLKELPLLNVVFFKRCLFPHHAKNTKNMFRMLILTSHLINEKLYTIKYFNIIESNRIFHVINCLQCSLLNLPTWKKRKNDCNWENQYISIFTKVYRYVLTYICRSCFVLGILLMHVHSRFLQFYVGFYR